jgi:hypothetical protein
MMKKLFILLMVSGFAFADPDDDCKGDPHHCNGGDTGGAQQTPTATATITSNPFAEAFGGSASSTGGSVGDISNTTIISNPEERLFRFLMYAAPSRAPNVYPTAPCVIAKSNAWAVPLLNTSKGDGVVDEDCERREEVRLAPTEIHRIGLWCALPGPVERWGSVDECIEYMLPPAIPPIESEMGYETVAGPAGLAEIVVEQKEEQVQAIERGKIRRAKARALLDQLEQKNEEED